MPLPLWCSRFPTVRRLADEEGLAVLLLEQNVGQALRIVDSASSCALVA